MEDIYAGIINKMIGNETKGVDHYNHNGSTWLIFTDEKKWVIEFTKEGTLWYNYNFFQNCFKLMSLDVVENQHYITKWVEDTIQNGVKNTLFLPESIQSGVEDTIQNGVRNISPMTQYIDWQVEEIIQNGVKNTIDLKLSRENTVKDTIQNGVKHTEDGDWLDGDERFNDIIQNGVKHTLGTEYMQKSMVNDVIENGVINLKK